MDKLELRMYGMVNYQLTGIQAGIQFAHAIVDYGQLMKTEYHHAQLKKYNDWADNWKTVILLNGGTTNNNPEKLGTLNTHLKELTNNGVLCQPFYEPDLGDQLTAFCFLVDERVFNKEKYPDFEYQGMGIKNSEILRENPLNPKFVNTGVGYIDYLAIRNSWEKWSTTIGGKSNLFLREYIRNFKLA